ncbi:MAG: hypothetical protein FJ215_13030, partial [Ignavibacteria bacterium]|nr:hypothetical protein [Ignavibacteria bacterium]
GIYLANVPYDDAKSGLVWFVADGENPIGLNPQRVDIGVTGAGKEGVGRVWVEASIEKFCQNDTSWGREPYDTYKELDKSGNIKQPEHQYSIGEKGCALAAMAMILNDAGIKMTPKTLNEKMTKDGYFRKNRKGNYNGSVDWTAVIEYGGALFKSQPLTGGTDSNWSSKAPIELNTIDPLLAKNNLVIALVGNKSARDTNKVSSHWVLITGKKNGEYQIIDPGCYRDRKTLSSYSNRVFRTISYERKTQ